MSGPQRSFVPQSATPAVGGASVQQGPAGPVTQPRGNAAAQDGAGLSSPGAGVCGPDEVRLPGYVPADGSLGFYQARFDDFDNRYADCGLTPPDYYLGYGEKYVSRFTVDTSPRLSPEGQAWLVQARLNLQIAIENRRATDPAAFDALEKDNDAFRAFAYGTHANAYWSAGLGDLSLFDLASIGLTPDVEDLVAWPGLTQVADIGSRLAGHWGEEGIDYVAGDGTTEELVNAAYQGFVVVGEGIDEAFGPGASQALVEGAQDLGVEAVELAEGAYDVAAEVVGDGADLIDDHYGEGTVSDTLNGARAWGQDRVEDVETTYNDATEWASQVWDDIF